MSSTDRICRHETFSTFSNKYDAINKTIKDHCAAIDYLSDLMLCFFLQAHAGEEPERLADEEAVRKAEMKTKAEFEDEY